MKHILFLILFSVLLLKNKEVKVNHVNSLKNNILKNNIESDTFIYGKWKIYKEVFNTVIEVNHCGEHIYEFKSNGLFIKYYSSDRQKENNWEMVKNQIYFTPEQNGKTILRNNYYTFTYEMTEPITLTLTSIDKKNILFFTKIKN